MTLPPSIQFKRGALSGLPSGSAGEPLFTNDQFRLYVGSAGGNRLVGVLVNNAATAAPTVNDDAGDGYSVGSVWNDTTNDKSYILLDSTVGSAVWQQFSGSGAGSVSDGDKGDITVSSSGTVWAIDNDAVSFAKMADITSQTLIGRNSVGTGDPQQVTIEQSLGWLSGSAAGAILYFNGSLPAWAALTAPTTGYGQALRWDSATGKPSWASPSYGRTVLGSTFNGTGGNGTFQASGLSVTIPAAGHYQIDATCRTGMGDTSAGYFGVTRLALNGTAITNTEVFSSYSNAAGGFMYETASQVYRASFATSDVISVQIAFFYAGTPSAARGLYSDGNGRSTLSYLGI